jgi:hypothetical protein
MQVKIPDKMETVRYQAPKLVEINGPEIPLIHPNDPKSKKPQEIWTAHYRLFDLSDEKQMKECEAVWQQICDGSAVFCEKNGPDWDSKNNRYVTLLRWATKSYKVEQ